MSKDEASFCTGGDRELVVFYEQFIGRPFEVHTDPSGESFQGPVWF